MEWKKKKKTIVEPFQSNSPKSFYIRENVY